MDSTRQTALETSLTGYRELIYVSNGGVPFAVYLSGVERRSTSRPKSTVIARSAGPADSRNGISGQFCPRIHPSATSAVHLGPILAIVRRSGFPCFVALGFFAGARADPKHSLQRLMIYSLDVILMSKQFWLQKCDHSTYLT